MSGVLAEQVHPYSNEPLSVSPLTWSHATFVTCVLEYLDRKKQLLTENVFAQTIIPV
jgi:GH15 family glucan-1,4-alpha-glucosidase